MDATIVEVCKLLNEYKQYFFFTVTAESDLSENEGVKVSCHMHVVILLELCKAG